MALFVVSRRASGADAEVIGVTDTLDDAARLCERRRAAGSAADGLVVEAFGRFGAVCCGDAEAPEQLYDFDPLSSRLVPAGAHP